MKIVRVDWAGNTALLRDPIERGEFVCGIECNEHGIAVSREGCTEGAELRIRSAHIQSFEEVTDDLRSVLVRSGLPGGDPDSDVPHAPGGQGASGGLQPEAEVSRSIQVTPHLRNVLLFLLAILIELVVLLGVITMLRALATR